jgi:hypothetical protein
MIPDDFPARIFQILEMAAMTDIPHFRPNRLRRIWLDCTARPVDDMTSHLGKLEYPE